MKFQISNFKFQKSFTLIEVLVGAFLMLIVFLGIFGVYQLGLKVVGLSKNKIIATAIANGQLEQIRNLPYESIGVQGSFPDGILEALSFITQNNIEYKIERRVDYVVDSIDGISFPEDDCPNDYKKAGIKVSWSGKFEGQVNFVTDISPKNLVQECAETGGILSVSVFDAYGLMVNSPLIEIKNPSSGETLKTATPAEGKHYFSLPPSTYKVVVSKNNYSTEQTYGSGDVYNGQVITTPERPHPIVLEGALTEVSFSIDKLSSMTIETRGTKSMEYPAIHNVTFTLTGAKKVGTDSDEKPIYKYSQNHTTNGSAKVDVSNLEWDSYSFLIVSSSLDLIGIESPPGTEIGQPVALAPDTALSVRLILKTENSLLITVQNIETKEPIFSAKVRLYNTDLDYDISQYTDEKGQTYFIPLTAATYNLDVEAAGYSSFSSTILVSGDKTEIIELEQIE